MFETYGDLSPSERLLLGPGPSNCHPRVLRALASPLLGHMDPEFMALLDQTSAMLRALFRTKNALTLAISATGSAGMETCLGNLLEPGDKALVCVNGVFGNRMCDIVERLGVNLVRLDAEWGTAFAEDTVCAAIARERPALVAIVHAETSTGVRQPVADIGACAREHGALFVLDTVTSLGGCPVEIDAWGVDAAYSGTQKCLSCPPGLSPVTFSERALERIRRRSRKNSSWYLDLALIMNYWGGDRAYHHTAPVSMVFALREALRLIGEEGLEVRWARHERNHGALAAGLEALGLALPVVPARRLWMLNAVSVPAGVDESAVRKGLLQRYGIEIGAGLGPLAGKIWRIGLMGHSSSRANVVQLLAALRAELAAQGRPAHEDPVAAACRVWDGA